MITVTTNIAAPAAFVRSTFLNFAELKQWHSSGWIKSIESTTPGKTSGEELVKGDSTRTEVAGMTVNQTILENSPTTFRMLGPWYNLLTGTHTFDFQPDPSNPNHCIFTQSESFTSILSPFMDSPTSMGGKKTTRTFREVNADLKRYSEAAWASRQ